jgi:hypothetical protein
MNNVVATIHVDSKMTVTRPEESAAAYHCIEVQPGAYPVELCTSRYDGSKYLAARFRGVVTSSGYGGRRYHEKEGKEDEVVLQPYKYELQAGKFRGRVEILDAPALESARGV